jgi:hypothetical protein
MVSPKSQLKYNANAATRTTTRRSLESVASKIGVIICDIKNAFLVDLTKSSTPPVQNRPSKRPRNENNENGAVLKTSL